MQHWLVVVATLIAVLGEYRLRLRPRRPNRCTRPRSSGCALQSELAAGRLQLLQAQIEPHFLFNSLANVRRLLRTDGGAGRAMLADLLRYLESALPRLRDDQPTLEREVEIVRAFLGVHQVRMGPRLQVDIDVPQALGDRIVPPMMLLTLVENALKHGLQPLLEGGSIRIGATERPDDAARCRSPTPGAASAPASVPAPAWPTSARACARCTAPRRSCRCASTSRAAWSPMIELPLATS